MASLTAAYYYGIVVGTTVDPMRTGGVQVRVLGVTDDWVDELQPWVYPQLGYGMQSVPQKGQYIQVHFIDGDINQGMYYGISQSNKFLPAEYVGSYPDIAYANLGELCFTYVHNRATHTTKIKNGGNGGTITWDPYGYVSIEANSASSEAGEPSFNVLTEATIDVFTCKPVGDPKTMARAGSEYLKASHISQKTVDIVRGAVSEPPKTTGDELEMPTAGEVREIVGVDDSDKEVTYTVPFEESPAVSGRTGNRTPKRILIGGTGGTLYSKMLESFLEDGATMCTHYLVGTADGAPDVIAGLQDELKAKNRGFVQMVELKDDTKFGSGGLLGGSDNVDAITVMFYTNSLGKVPNETYAFSKLRDIIHHVKRAYALDEIEVVAYKGNALDYAGLMQWEGEY